MTYTSYTGFFAYIGQKSFDYVKSNNLIAFFRKYGDNMLYGGKTIQVMAHGKTVTTLIADTCGNNDCDAFCMCNAGSSGYLVDLEYHMVVKNFGLQPVAQSAGRCYTGAVDNQVIWQKMSN
jgi:hypothetical protein